MICPFSPTRIVPMERDNSSGVNEFSPVLDSCRQ